MPCPLLGQSHPPYIILSRNNFGYTSKLLCYSYPIQACGLPLYPAIIEQLFEDHGPAKATPILWILPYKHWHSFGTLWGSDVPLFGRRTPTQDHVVGPLELRCLFDLSPTRSVVKFLQAQHINDSKRRLSSSHPQPNQTPTK